MANADSCYFANDYLTNDGAWSQALVAKLKTSNYVYPADNGNYVSIKEETINELTIFPNPSKGKFSLSLEGQVGNASCKVYDIKGSCILTQENIAGNTIDISGNEKGIYFVELKADEKIFRRKIVIE